jgi:hypothetical protein
MSRAVRHLADVMKKDVMMYQDWGVQGDRVCRIASPRLANQNLIFLNGRNAMKSA